MSLKGNLKQKIFSTRKSYSYFLQNYKKDSNIFAKAKTIIRAKNLIKDDDGSWERDGYKTVDISGLDDYFGNIKKLLGVKKVKGYNLVRVGRNYDGGYVLINDFSDISKAYSFGIADDISFENDLNKKGVSKIYCYDPTVSGLPGEGGV